MPTLSITVSPTDISGLYVDNELNVSSVLYPYPYSAIFRNNFSISPYVEAVIGEIHLNLAKGKIDKTTKILISSYADIPDLKLKIHSFKKIDEILESISELKFYFESGTFSDSGEKISNLHDATVISSENSRNYFSNIEFYPQVLPKNRSNLVSLDFSNQHVSAENDSNSHLIFSGYRFSSY